MSKAIIESQVAIKKVTPDKQFVRSCIYGIIAILTLISLYDYDPKSFHSSPPSDTSPLLGQFGLQVARNILASLGISAWLLPWLFGTLSFLSYKKTQSKEKSAKLATILLSILSISTLANIRDTQNREVEMESLFDPNVYEHGAGGSLGAIIYSGQSINSKPENRYGGFLKIWLGSLGSTFLSVLILVICLSTHFSFSPFKFILNRLNLLNKKLEPEGTKSEEKIEKSIEGEREKEVANKKENTFVQKGKKKRKFFWQNEEDEEDVLFEDVSKIPHSSIQSKTNAISVANSPSNKKKISPEKKDTNVVPNDDISTVSEKASSSGEDDFTDDPISSELDNDPSVGMEGFKVVRAAKTEKAGDLFPERKGDYHFPPMELLMEPPEEETIGDEDHILKAKRLQDTLKEFKIEVEMGEVHTGPVITRYDLHPAAGVRVEKNC
jgi:S-DNA-T family DNA segregation ATPase FtsK/SpoIIIE